MAQLRLKNPSIDSWSITAEDMKRHGVEGFTKVTWSKDNKFTADVSDDAAAKLVELYPKEFELVGSETVEESDDGDDASSSDAESSKKRSRSS